MALTPEQLDEAKQLLGLDSVPEQEQSQPAASEPVTEPVTEPVAATEPVVDATTTEPEDSVSVYCPNCSHLLAKVSK